MPVSKRPQNPAFPPAEAIAALRARLQGVPAGDVVRHYLPERARRGGSARVILGEIRQDIVQFARVRGREDLGRVIIDCATRGSSGLRDLDATLEKLRALPLPPPQIGDEVTRWLPARVASVLEAAGIKSLADLTVRVPRSSGWWQAIPGLGKASAALVERLFAANPELTERARALIAHDAAEVKPLERHAPREHLDGSAGRNRAPASTCLLGARNDLQAIESWLALHEAATTKRAYRKEAERVLLWAVIQLGKPMSSLTTDDAIAYRDFLRNPVPAGRWIGPHRLRSDPAWRPFTGPLTASSAAYALTVVKSLFAWLVDQRYLLANPFSGIKVRGAQKRRVLDTSRSFTEAEWSLVRTIANDFEREHGWETEAAVRARFLLDFFYATGLRPGELVCLQLGAIEQDDEGAWWIRLRGKGAKEGDVAVPPIGLTALGRYLDLRGIVPDPLRWDPTAPVVASLHGEAGISATRLWAVISRAFKTIENVLSTMKPPQPALLHKLRKASGHWMRHTHASHALARGADLLSVRDNLRHSSLATTSIYLRAEDAKRNRQMADAFAD
jgi:site-specific recombinase XerD